MPTCIWAPSTVGLYLGWPRRKLGRAVIQRLTK
jgi:hypothetical protein